MSAASAGRRTYLGTASEVKLNPGERGVSRDLGDLTLEGKNFYNFFLSLRTLMIVLACFEFLAQISLALAVSPMFRLALADCA